MHIVSRQNGSLFYLTDQLCHGAHGTVDTPAAGLEQHHGDEAQDGRGQHNAVKTESKLRHAGVKESTVVSPVPGELKGPQQRDHLPQVLRSGKYQIGVPQH